MEIKVNSKSLSKLELKSPNEFIKEKTNEINLIITKLILYHIIKL